MDATRAMGRTADDVETASGERPRSFGGIIEFWTSVRRHRATVWQCQFARSLDPIVAEIIEAPPRTIIRDEDRRASLPRMNKNE